MTIARAYEAALLVVAVSSLLGTGCREDVVIQEGLTGVQLTVTHDREVDQLAIDITPETETTIELDLVPERPRALSPNGESVSILLDERFGNLEATIRARGFKSGVPSAAGLTVVTLRPRELVPATIELGAPAVCGDQAVAAGFEGCDDGNTLDEDGCSSGCDVEEGWACDLSEPSQCRVRCGETTCERGQYCDEGECACNATSCPDGCCSADQCNERSYEHCGLLGRACVECNENRSDTCSVDGYCACGPASECAPGELCENEMCICSDESCAGCCSDARCERRSFELCGVDGATCVACHSMVANTCTPEGECKCGANDPCLQGQRCISGACSCDGISCPDGCCAFGQCVTPLLRACGTRGGACESCDEEMADRCRDDGTCSCGGAPPCRAGQRCIDAACVCDSVSCPDGCCRDSTCVSPTRESCGALGLACFTCDALAADGCSESGACQCGDSAECAPGQHCLGGECLCDWVSCEGCCDVTGHCLSGTEASDCGVSGNLCEACASGDCESGICSECTAATCSGCCGPTCRMAQEFPVCGVNGGACTNCDPIRSDQCFEGDCSCSGNAQCLLGQQCIGGGCICNDVSCPASCCDGVECRERGVSACGVAGASCIACDAARANSCSAAGECLCGSRPACDEGQRCAGDSCVCDSESCSNGCCRGGLCETYSAASCSPPGATCRPCDGQRADGCSDVGECLCGDGPACEVGQHCSHGLCLCDGSSCLGCCSGEECLLGGTQDACGSAGGICDECPETETCIGGSCTGCDVVACFDGCCSGIHCRDPSLLSCGADGQPCVACNLVETDRCVDGECRCGDESPCGDGQHCVLGSCICDDLSCPFGCCSGGICRTLSMTTCAPLGAECQACDSDAADNCSPHGECRCGSRPLCGDGLECIDGWCR